MPKFSRLAALLTAAFLLTVAGRAAEWEVVDRFSVDGSSLFKSTVTVQSGAGQNYAFGVKDPSSNFILFLSTTGNVGIGTTNPDNSYQGLTIYGSNPSLRLKSNNANGWEWTEYATPGGANNFSAGVNKTTPYYGIAAGAGMDNPAFAINSAKDVALGNSFSGGTFAGATMVIKAAGNVGIGTTGPAGKLSVQGTGAAYGLFVSTDSAGNAGNLVVNNSGNTGIRVNDPNASLEVYSSYGSGTPGDNPALRFRNQDGSQFGFRQYNPGPYYTLNLDRVSGSWTTPVITFSAQGNVGIGSTGPDTAFHVKGANLSNTGQLKVQGSGTNVEPRMSFYDSNGNERALIGDDATRFFIQSGPSRDLSLMTDNGGTVGVYVKSGGNVGIGTTSPGYPLHVAGNMYVSGNLTCGGTGCGSGTSQWTTGGSGIYFNGGNVGIGTAAQGAKLHVYGGGIRQGSDAAQYININQDGGGVYLEQAGTSAATSKIRLQTSKSSDFTNYSQLNIDPTNGFSFVGLGTGSGSVGIGTTNPGGILDVGAVRQLLVSNTSDAADYIQITGGGPSNSSRPSVLAAGSDPNITLQLGSKGSGQVAFLVNSSFGFAVNGVSGSSNRVEVTDAASGGTPYFSAVGSDTSVNLALFPKGGGNVGIGTLGPNLGKLQVFTSDGSAITTGLVLDNQNTAGKGTKIQFAQTGNSNEVGRIANFYDADSKWKMQLGTFGALTALTIDAGGNVGIGTAGPSTGLHVAGANDSASFITSQNTGMSGSPSFQFGMNSGNNAGLIQLTAGKDIKFWNGQYALTILGSNGSVGIGTASPNGKLSVQGTGTTYGLFVSTDGAGNVGNLVVNNSGNVGIGTTAPAVNMHIYGATAARVRLDPASGQAGLEYALAGTRKFSLYQWADGSSIRLWSDMLSNDLINLYSSGNVAFPSGSVGIGTVGPETLLEVKDSSNSSNNGISLGDTGQTALTGNRFIGITKVGDPTSIGINSGFYGMTLTGVGGARGGSLGFSTWHYGISSGERMTIDQDGNVGIGTTAPSSKLTVEGGVEIRSGNILMLRPAANDWDMRLMSVGAGMYGRLDVLSGGSGTPIASFVHGGSVGIGTTGPGYTLDVNGTAHASTQITTPLINLTGGQVAFPAAQSPSSDPNTLDDYREGTWAPTITGSVSGSGSPACYTYYVKVGRMVIANVRYVGVTFPAYTGSLRISMPFAAGGANNVVSYGAPMYFYPLANWSTGAAFAGWVPQVVDGNSFVEFGLQQVNGDRQSLATNSNTSTSGASGLYLSFSITYMAAQ